MVFAKNYFEWQPILSLTELSCAASQLYLRATGVPADGGKTYSDRTKLTYKGFSRKICIECEVVVGVKILSVNFGNVRLTMLGE